MSSQAPKVRITKTLFDLCKQRTTQQDIFIEKGRAEIPYRVKTTYFRGKKITEETLKRSVTSYEKLNETLREWCESVYKNEEKVKDDLKTEIQDRDIGLIVGIPATAGVAATLGHFAPSMLKVLKVFLKIN